MADDLKDIRQHIFDRDRGQSKRKNFILEKLKELKISTCNVIEELVVRQQRVDHEEASWRDKMSNHGSFRQSKANSTQQNHQDHLQQSSIKKKVIINPSSGPVVSPTLPALSDSRIQRLTLEPVELDQSSFLNNKSSIQISTPRKAQVYKEQSSEYQLSLIDNYKSHQTGRKIQDGLISPQIESGNHSSCFEQSSSSIVQQQVHTNQSIPFKTVYKVSHKKTPSMSSISMNSKTDRIDTARFEVEQFMSRHRLSQTKPVKLIAKGGTSTKSVFRDSLQKPLGKNIV